MHGPGGEDCPCRSSSFRMNVWTAAQHGATERLRHLVEAHGEAGAMGKGDEYAHVPLLYAAQGGHASSVAFILSALCSGGGGGVPSSSSSPSPSSPSPQLVVVADGDYDGCGVTPLHRSAYGGHLDVCRLLLDAGARVSAVDRGSGDLRTPLHKAAAQGHLSVVRLLLDRGADVDAADRRGATARALAAEAGHAAVAELLLLFEGGGGGGGGGGVGGRPSEEDGGVAPQGRPAAEEKPEPPLALAAAATAAAPAAPSPAVGLACAVCGETALIVLPVPGCPRRACMGCAQCVRAVEARRWRVGGEGTGAAGVVCCAGEPPPDEGRRG
jgi:hypothetical protein